MTRITLKGLRKDEEDLFDFYYYVRGQLNGKPHFEGTCTSHIYYSPNDSTWRLDTHPRNAPKGDRTHFLLYPHNEELPFGVFEVKKFVGTNSGSEEVKESRKMTFSSCHPDKFTCTKGGCIPLE